MKRKKLLRLSRVICVCLLYAALPGKSIAQNWSVNFAIGTTTGNYSFSYNKAPDPLTEVFSAIAPVDVGCTYQWQQSTSPLFTTYSNATGSSTAVTYNFSTPLAQTTYFRLLVTSAGSSVYSNIIKINIVSVNWEDINYTRKHEVITAGIPANWTTVDSLAIGQKLQTTSYVDGLGRSVEKIGTGMATPVSGSSVWGDIVQFTQYDAYGRQPLNYQPYTTTTTPGKYKTAPLSEQPSYYSSIYNETYAYTSTTYDKSPLNRNFNVKESGTSWAAGPGNSASYDVNTASDSVQIFTTDYVQGDAPVNAGTYPANSLYKRIATDENGKQVITYTEKTGKTILTKVQISTTPATGHSGWICTYYVYDDFDQLRCLIEPAAVNYLVTNSWSFAGANGVQVLNEMCSQFYYDDKGHVTWKKLPGAAPLQMLYDIRDRVVFMQDGNQAALSPNQWTANLYDMLDRVTTTLLYNTSETITALQTDISNATSTAAFTNPISPTNLGNAAVTTILNYFYYDNYTYTGVKAFSTNFDNNTAYNPSGNPNVIPIANSARTIGYQTGSMTRVLGTTTFLESSEYYDEKGRHIQTLADNILQGLDITTSQYHWDGRLLSSSRKHTTTGSGYTSFPILTVNVYDKIARISTIKKQFGSNPLKTVISYTYDLLSRPGVLTLDSGYAGSGKNNLESLAYSYNIHGQLTGINKSYALKDSTYSKWGNFFGLYLGYDNKDNVFAAKQLDGHVTGQLWSTQGDDAQRKYDYTYDYPGRLINAAYNEEQQPGSGWNHSMMDFSVTGNSGQITYDLNGNLLNMIQKGVLPGQSAPAQIDNLTYTYLSYSNKVSYITDNGNAGAANGLLGDFKDGTNAAGTADYTYDANGNVVTDLNKSMGSSSTPGITYNFQDKPTQVIITGKGTVNFVYDGNGNKLQKIFIPASGATITTSYAGEFIYQSKSTTPGVDSLQYIIYESGRIRVMQPVNQNNGYDVLAINGNITLPNNMQGVFDFFIHDHLSDVRMVLTEEVHTGSNTCTMETSRAAAEDPIFQGSGNEVENTRVAITTIPGQTTGGGWHSNTSASVSQLGDYTGAFKMGPNVLLKVMAGDTINATTQYYYQAAGTYTAGTAGLMQGVLTSLINAITGGSAASTLVKNGSSGIQTALNGSAPFGIITDPGTAGSANTAAPQAYLTIMFFDERFNYVGTSSQWQQVSQAGDGASPLVLANIQAPKNGYAYIYVSNKSTQPVYFDNMKVGLNHGRIIEEDHYYSFGLKIAGISSTKLGNTNEGMLKNQYQYQGDYSEFVDETGWNDFELRNYDPQTGRFIQQDPYSQYPSPYTGMGNDPIINVDEDGGFSGGAIGSLIGIGIGFAAPYAIEAITGKHIDHKGLWGLAGAFAGAGVGYGVGEALSDGGSFINETRAFYKGLFSPGTEGQFISDKGGFSQCFNWISGYTSAQIPDLWNWSLNIRLPNLPALIWPIIGPDDLLIIDLYFHVNEARLNDEKNRESNIGSQLRKIQRSLRRYPGTDLTVSGGILGDKNALGSAVGPPDPGGTNEYEGHTPSELARGRAVKAADYIIKHVRAKFRNRIKSDDKVIDKQSWPPKAVGRVN
jgi:RHS repeat-associated protein